MARTLTDLDDSELQSLVTNYGHPKKLHFNADFLDFECDLVRRSEAKGRHHDVTCFIRHPEGWVVIQKHAYAGTGIFRAPSGGANPGESIEEAAIREMHEETGLTVQLREFILDVSLDVRCPDRTIPWRSLVFLADAVDGEVEIVDKYEIHAVKIMSRNEILGTVQDRMQDTGWGGFSYRAFLTENFFRTLDELEKKKKT